MMCINRVLITFIQVLCVASQSSIVFRPQTGCSVNMTLICYNNLRISIQKAFYGFFRDPCNDLQQCCQTNSHHCMLNMEKDSMAIPVNFENIISTCNGQNTCSLAAKSFEIRQPKCGWVSVHKHYDFLTVWFACVQDPSATDNYSSLRPARPTYRMSNFITIPTSPKTDLSNSTSYNHDHDGVLTLSDGKFWALVITGIVIGTVLVAILVVLVMLLKRSIGKRNARRSLQETSKNCQNEASNTYEMVDLPSFIIADDDADQSSQNPYMSMIGSGLGFSKFLTCRPMSDSTDYQLTNIQPRPQAKYSSLRQSMVIDRPPAPLPFEAPIHYKSTGYLDDGKTRKLKVSNGKVERLLAIPQSPMVPSGFQIYDDPEATAEQIIRDRKRPVREIPSKIGSEINNLTFTRSSSDLASDTAGIERFNRPVIDLSGDDSGSNSDDNDDDDDDAGNISDDDVDYYNKDDSNINDLIVIENTLYE